MYLHKLLYNDDTCKYNFFNSAVVIQESEIKALQAVLIPQDVWKSSHHSNFYFDYQVAVLCVLCTGFLQGHQLKILILYSFILTEIILSMILFLNTDKSWFQMDVYFGKTLYSPIKSHSPEIQVYAFHGTSGL